MGNNYGNQMRIIWHMICSIRKHMEHYALCLHQMKQEMKNKGKKFYEFTYDRVSRQVIAIIKKNKGAKTNRLYLMLSVDIHQRRQFHYP